MKDESLHDQMYIEMSERYKRAIELEYIRDAVEELRNDTIKMQHEVTVDFNDN